LGKLLATEVDMAWLTALCSLKTGFLCTNDQDQGCNGGEADLIIICLPLFLLFLNLLLVKEHISEIVHYGRQRLGQIMEE
jgi:hypothetical protein